MNPNKNTAQSVKDRLLQIARQRNESFTNLLIRYAIERLLYRLSKSEYSKKFVLKGAALFNYWYGEPHRATLDADFSVRNRISTAETEDIIRKICIVEAEDDGLIFLSESVSSSEIRVEDAYQGVRTKLKAKLGKAVIPIQLDIGFGDFITPPPEEIEYPTLLDFPAPKLTAYTPETSIAEKVQVIIERGIQNSRIKDYYDVWFLIDTFEIDEAKLQSAIKEVFNRRKTIFPKGVPTGLSREFIEDGQKKAQWKSFQKKIGNKEADVSLENMVVGIRDFILPVIEAAAKKSK